MREQKGKVMQDNKLKLEVMSREIRLLYYNDYLFEQGVITKREHDKMNLDIISLCGKSMRNQGKDNSHKDYSSARYV